MKALTLWQPWASLVALGVKTIETRSWSTSYRGPLAIHAAKKLADCPQCRIGDYWCEYWTSEPGPTGWRLLGPAGVPREPGTSHPVSLGAVVATCRLVGVLPIRDSMDPDTSNDYIIVGHRVGMAFVGDESFGVLHEVPYGDYTPGRYAWLLGDIKPLAEPIPARGRQGLWNWEASASA